MLVRLLTESLRVARQGYKGTRSFEKQLMYFALMIVIAFVVAALVLLLEHRGDTHLLERKDGSRAKPPDKTPTK